MNLKNFGIIEGRLTRDVEVRTSESGNTCGFLTVAINRDYKNKSGEYDTDFIRVSVYGKTAEFVGKYFKKGDAIQLQTTLRSYIKAEVVEGGNTVNKTHVDVIAEAVNFPQLAKKSNDGNDNLAKASTVSAGLDELPGIDVDDDLPF